MTDTYEGKDRTSPALYPGLVIVPSGWPFHPRWYIPDWFRAVTVYTFGPASELPRKRLETWQYML